MARRAPVSPVDLLADGQAALRNGDKLRAQVLFRTVLQHDPDNEDALLWLSGAVEPPEAVRYLQQVLAVNPANQQAREGLAWFQHTYGIVELEPPPVEPPTIAAPQSAPAAPVESRRDATPAAQLAPPVRPARAVIAPTALGNLVECASHVVVIGALVGLVRLVIALRPTALLIGRGAAGKLGWAGAGGIALLAAITHALVLLLAWWLLADRMARLRNDRQGDLFHSLLDAGRALLPGYLATPALGLALLSVSWSEQRWFPVVVALWALLGGALVVASRRVLRLRGPLRMVNVNTRRQLIAFVGPAVIAGTVGLWLAGWIVVLVLRQA